MHKIVLSLLLISFAGSAIATPPEFIGDKYRGWFFHEQEVTPEEEPKEPEVEPKKAAAAPEPKPLTQAWFAKNLPLLKDKAIDSPTKDNIANYLVAQKLWMNSASNFALTATNVTMENPWLTDERFRPSTAFGTSYYDKRAKQTRSELVKRISETTGVWFFFSSTCEYCHVQSPVLRDLQDRLGIKVLAVSMDGKGLPDFPRFMTDQGHAARYGVTAYPTMMLYHDNKLYPFAEGLVTSEQLVDRLIYYAKENGWITKQDWNRAQPVDYNQNLSPEFMRNISPKEAGNPALLLEKVRRQLMQQM